MDAGGGAEPVSASGKTLKCVAELIETGLVAHSASADLDAVAGRYAIAITLPCRC